MTSQENKTEYQIQLKLAQSMSSLDPHQWNTLANPDGTPYDPFLDWNFLDALETSESVRPNTGWAPQHVLAHDSHGALLGAMPMYVKGHSMGEFVFDHRWADAFERAGGRYYPKLLCAIPYTPVTGRRLLATPGDVGDTIRPILCDAAITLTENANLSSCHVNFVTPSDRTVLENNGFLLRRDRQFHWHNRDYGDFEDFLSDLSSRKRKNIRKERAIAQKQMRFEHITGSALTTEIWDSFYQFYVDTNTRKWNLAPLTREFFDLLGQRMADRILLIVAFHDDQPVAAALNMIGSHALFGRYWGCSGHLPFMHFELCYYQAIDYAITHGLAQVEGGAQGEHKLARGYQPQPTWSAHWIANQYLRDAVEKYLRSERHCMADDTAQLQQRSPFRHGLEQKCKYTQRTS